MRSATDKRGVWRARGVPGCTAVSEKPQFKNRQRRAQTHADRRRQETPSLPSFSPCPAPRKRLLVVVFFVFWFGLVAERKNTLTLLHLAPRLHSLLSPPPSLRPQGRGAPRCSSCPFVPPALSRPHFIFCLGVAPSPACHAPPKGAWRGPGRHALSPLPASNVYSTVTFEGGPRFPAFLSVRGGGKRSDRGLCCGVVGGTKAKENALESPQHSTASPPPISHHTTPRDPPSPTSTDTRTGRRLPATTKGGKRTTWKTPSTHRWQRGDDESTQRTRSALAPPRKPPPINI